MLHLRDDFSVWGEDGQAYSLRAERSSNLAHNHAHVEAGALSIDCFGNKYLLRAPKLRAFSLRFEFGYTYLTDKDTAWMLHPRYDERERAGEYLRFAWTLSGEATVERWRADGVKRVRLSSARLGSRKPEEGEWYGFELRREGGFAEGTFAGFAFREPIAEGEGLVALERDDFLGALLMRRLELDSEDELPEREIWPKVTVAMPLRDGGKHPYTLTWSARDAGGQAYLDFELSGGTHFFTTDAPARDCQYTVEQDRFFDPYLRLYGKRGARTFALRRGMLAFTNQLLAWECLKRLFQTENPPVRVSLPVDARALEGARIAFGYRDLHADGYHAQSGGPTEFVYESDGALLYEGEPLTGDALELFSPFDKRAVALIPEDAVRREEVARHFALNHYFAEDEPISLTLRVLTSREPRRLSARVTLEDACGKPISQAEALAREVGEGVLGRNECRFAFARAPLPLGVYRARFELFYGEEPLRVYDKAFEVFDETGEKCAPLESGLPFLYSTPNEQRFLDRDSFDPWSPKPSCDLEHYFACCAFTPDIARERQIWNVVKRFGRKWYAWLSARTLDEYDWRQNLDIVQNADFLFCPTPFDNCPLRNDYWNIGSYNAGLLGLVDEFLAQTPGARAYVGWSKGEPFGKKHLDALHRGYRHAWYDYATSRVHGMILEQNEEFRRVNPSWKRASYGPFAIYTIPYATHAVTRAFGNAPDDTLARDVFTGFAQFEDYPFSCAYQTWRGSFAVATLLLHCPGLVIYPEQYRSSYGGCIDGAVKFANPPMGAYAMPEWYTTMQTYEYVYNTPYFDGKRFAYWTSYGFMKRDNDDGDLSGFLRGWAETRGRLPRQPLRAAAFVAEYDPADDRYDEEYEDAFGVSNIHNVSEEGQAMLYGCSRTAGLPLGFACGWEGLLALTPEQTDLLVLPSLAHAPEGVLAKIRALHQAGVSLFATSEVTGLEDLFGVKRAPRKAKIRALEYGEETEFVTPYEASFGYEPHGARAALTADGLPALLTYRRTALLNAPASELGRYSFLGNWQTGKESVSLLLKAACEQALRALSAPLAKADGAGITLFRDENGRLTLLAIDYSPYESFSENEPREVAVRLNLNGVTDAPGADNRFFEGGELREIALSLRPHEAKLITLCERAN